jgi:Fur family ferric uptake transcriptional regulator
VDRPGPRFAEAGDGCLLERAPFLPGARLLGLLERRASPVRTPAVPLMVSTRFEEACLGAADKEHTMAGQLNQLLHECGSRITPQRRAILETILKHQGHLSADEIHDLARRKIPRLSLSTVYRTLDLLKELDLVSELHLAGNHYRYEAQSTQHQHLVCAGCGKVIEFQCRYCPGMQKKLSAEHGFRVTGTRVELFGYCDACASERNNSLTLEPPSSNPIPGDREE